MALELKEDDIFLIHVYGDRDGRPLFLRINERGEYNWTPHRSCASELSQFEACQFIEDGKKTDKKAWAIRCVGSFSE